MNLVNITKNVSKLMRTQMKKKQFTIILSLAALLMCISINSAAAKPMIKEILFESPSATADKIIFKLNGPYLPTGKALPGSNPRIYFDFPDTTPSGKVKNRISVDGDFVKQIRHAYHKTPKIKTRVVLDLVANQKMDFKQDFDTDTNTLVITLFLAGAEPEPVPAPEPVAMPEPTPEPVAVPEPVAKPVPEPEPSVAVEPVQPVSPESDIEKKVQPTEDISIAAVPKTQTLEPKAVTEPEQAVIPAPEPEPVAVPEPEPEPEKETPQVASIPPSSKLPGTAETPKDEATIIQPMSEVGVQDQGDVKDEAPVLHSIEYDPESNRGEMISFKLNGFHPPVVFGIEEDIPRIVCFFKNASGGSELKDLIGTGGRYVKNIKVGKYQNPDNIRVVLELVPGNNYDLQQVFFKDDKVFMLIINKAGKQISTQSN